MFIDWQANQSPPWAAYRAFVSGRLIEIYKYKSVCKVGVEETRRCLFSKCVMRVMGSETTNKCQDDQLCSSEKVRIKGSLQGDQYIWDTKSSTEY